MRKALQFVLYYPLTSLLVVAIWVVCLIPIPETPLNKVALIDKWTHFVMYGVLCAVAWAEYGKNHTAFNTWKAMWFLCVLPLVMGALVEVAQAYCTAGVRNGDVKDCVADTIGVLLGQFIGIPLARALSRRSKG